MINEMESTVIGATDGKFVCSICFKRFKQSGNLWRHIRKHTGERPYPCTVCSYRAGRKDNLDLHMGAKHGIFRYRKDT